MSASLTTRRALAAVLAAGALIGAAAMPAAADGHGHGRDNGRNHGRDHVREHDHGRDNGRDNGRDQGRGRDHGRDHGRDNGRDNGRDHRAPSSIAIGEVQNEDGMRGDRFGRALNREWVEVKNTGRHAVNLRGYTLTDEQGNRYRFPDFRLDGRSSVKVHTGQGRNTATTCTRTAAGRCGTTATPPPSATTAATSSTPSPGAAAATTTATADRHTNGAPRPGGRGAPCRRGHADRRDCRAR